MIIERSTVDKNKSVGVYACCHGINGSVGETTVRYFLPRFSRITSPLSFFGFFWVFLHFKQHFFKLTVLFWGKKRKNSNICK
jgi:hypothetical protein